MKRHDLYNRPHKALRAAMADALVAIGRMDPEDDCEVRDALARLEDLLAFCERHAAIENEFVHRALEERRADSSCAFATAHEDHGAAIEELRSLSAQRSPRLQRRLAVFIAENLLHMEAEESAANALLWELFTDAELGAIEARVVASMAPGHAMQGLRWMLPALNHRERAAMLEGMRRAPAAVFEGAMGVARTHLAPHDLEKLEAALAQREPATLTS